MSAGDTHHVAVAEDDFPLLTEDEIVFSDATTNEEVELEEDILQEDDLTPDQIDEEDITNKQTNVGEDVGEEKEEEQEQEHVEPAPAPSPTLTQSHKPASTASLAPAVSI